MAFIGIDVAKGHLDVCAHSGPSWRVPNTPEGTTALLARLDALTPSLIALEPTGGYERLPLDALAAAGFPVVLVNARKVKDFARASGQIAKTDRLDARTLARYAEAIRPSPRVIPDPAARQLVALIARRRQLLVTRTAERNRLPLADPYTADSIARHLSWLTGEIAATDRAILRTVRDSPAWADRAALLRTVPGVGPTLAATLLVELPELGTIDRHEIAALVGLAPYNVDSGSKRGYRRIVGGRSSVRAALYLPTLTATRCNPVIAATYARLKASGKPHLVALTACMRRLAVILNAIVKSGRPWEDRLVPNSTMVPLLPEGIDIEQRC